MADEAWWEIGFTGAEARQAFDLLSELLDEPADEKVSDDLVHRTYELISNRRCLGRGQT